MNAVLRTALLLAGWLAASAALATTTVTTVHLVGTDAQGTVVAKMTPEGQVTYEAAYRPYGQQALGTPEAGPGYTGHVNDPDTGLVYMQQRYYDPDTQHFQSVDPIAPTPGNLYNINRYAYANNNPIIFTDPDGEKADDEDYIHPVGFARCKLCLSDGNNSSTPSPTPSDVFVHYTTDALGRGTISPLPAKTRQALTKILLSPVGKEIAAEAISEGKKIGLALEPSYLSPEFHWDAGGGVVLYSLNFRSYINKSGSEFKGADLDTLLIHEIGHSPIAARALGYPYSPQFKWVNEFNVVRYAENPYRAFIGLPLRQTYGGYSVPPPLIGK